ncbi:hypothetical protein BT69DRAFT_298 [Atractiella rhizophila]|nr:hypothetical protein BT69DRAFT_298 [Atractiella rhizophila]
MKMSKEDDHTFVEWTKDAYHAHIFPIIIGASLGFIFFGISLHQFLHVFRLYHERSVTYSISWWILMGLFWVNLGDTINKFFSFVSYMEDAARVGPVLLLAPPVPSTLPVAVFQGTLTAYVQLLYIYRIVRISRGMPKFGSLDRTSKAITYSFLCLAGALIVTSFVGFVLYGICLTYPIDDYFPKMLVPGSLALGAASLVDIILCGLMVHHLRQHKDKSGFQKTNFMATRFIKLTLETGLIPTITQVLELLFLVIEPRTGLWAGMGYVVAKVYVVAALVLFEAALSGSINSSNQDHETTKETARVSRELSRVRFRDQILREGVTEQPVGLQDMQSPIIPKEVWAEKNRMSPSSLPSYES